MTQSLGSLANFERPSLPGEDFQNRLSKHELALTRKPVETLQINIGKLCNQACLHCHVESSPIRTENMSAKTLDRIVELLSNTPSIKTVEGRTAIPPGT